MVVTWQRKRYDFILSLYKNEFEVTYWSIIKFTTEKEHIIWMSESMAHPHMFLFKGHCLFTDSLTGQMFLNQCFQNGVPVMTHSPNSRFISLCGQRQNKWPFYTTQCCQLILGTRPFFYLLNWPADGKSFLGQRTFSQWRSWIHFLKPSRRISNPIEKEMKALARNVLARHSILNLYPKWSFFF